MYVNNPTNCEGEPESLCRDFDSRLPLPNVVTYNVRGLSLNSPRGNFILANIRELAKKADIIALQETHLLTEDKDLENKFKDFSFFYENFTSRARGVITMVRNSWSVHYSIKETASPDCQKGRSLSLHFDPKTPTLLLHSFTCTNVYVSTGNSQQATQERAQLFNKLRRELREGDHYILLGDFNFEVDSDDSIDFPHKKTTIAKGFRDSWESLVKKARLKEVFQPSDTWFAPSHSPTHTNSSRIDRIYISEDLFFNNAYEPQANMAFIPHGILGSLGKSGRNNEGFKSYYSDHHPVQLKFFLPGKPRSPNCTIPREVYNHSKYRDLVLDNWNDRDSLPPFVRLANFKKAVKKGVRLFQEKKQSCLGHKGILGLTIAIDLLREGLRISPDPDIIARLTRKLPSLRDFVKDATVKTSELNSHIKKLVANQDMEHEEDPFSNPNPFGDYLKGLKKLLPASRPKLHQLRLESGAPPTSDPGAMGLLARTFWGKVWDKEEIASEEEIDYYLSDYTKVVKTPPPSPL